MATPPGHGAAETPLLQKYSTKQCLNTTSQTPAQEYSESEEVIKKQITQYALKKEWKTVVTFLEELQYCDEQCDWAIKEVVMKAPLSVVSRLTGARCSVDRFNTVLTHLMTRNLWTFVGNVLQRGLSDTKYREAVHNSIGRQVSDENFTIYVLEFCTEDNLAWLLTRLVKQRVWRALDILLQRDVGDSLRRLAIEVCSKASTSYEFRKHALWYCRDDEVNVVITNLVKQGELKAVGRLLQRGVSDELLTWVFEECMRQKSHAFVMNVLPHCAKQHVNYALNQYVQSGVWWAVGELLRRDVPVPLHRHAVEEASKRAKAEQFSKHILHHCRDDERDCVLNVLVKRQQWMAANEVLQRGVSVTHRFQAIQEASKRAPSKDLIPYVLPHCPDGQLGSVLEILVSRGLWEAASKVLQRGVTGTDHVQAIQEASKRAPSKDLIQYILPHCPDDQLGSVLEILVERGLWEAVENVFPRCASVTYSRWAIKRAIAQEKAEHFSKYILPRCTKEQLDFALTQILTSHQWLTMEKVLKRGVTDTQCRQAVEECSQRATGDDFTQYALPYCFNDQLDSVLKHLVTRGLWDAAEKVLKQGVSEVCQRWAIEKCSQRATGDDFTQYALPYCFNDQLDSVLKHLITRGLWDTTEKILKQGVSKDCQRWEVAGQVLQQGVSGRCQRWTVEEYSIRATANDITQYALPYCCKDQLDSVLENLVRRNYWETAEKVLQQGVSDRCRKHAVEECSQRASGSDFVQYALPYCAENDLDSVLSNLVKRREWEAAGKLLRQCKPCTHNENCKAGARAEDVRVKETFHFDSYILPCHYGHVLPFFVECQYSGLISNVLHDIVCETLCAWATPLKQSPYVDTFWTIVENSRVSAIRAIYLFSLMKVDTVSRIHTLNKRLGLKRELCELLYTSLLHNVCVVLCSASRNHTALTEPVKSCLLDIYTKITTSTRHTSLQSVEDIISHFGSIREAGVMFWELNGSVSSPVQLFFHFLEQFNLYYANRKQKHDDDVLLMMFAVLPLFPELQSVALSIMLSHRRWDVLSHACLSRVWEQDRRHLLQTAVKQRQWSVVRQWADHSLYDDQRVWALDETLKEKQWNVALLLADYGLTDTELMRVRYRLAKYADWDTVLHMFERGADVAEVSERLGRMNEDKKMNSSLKLDIRQRYIQALGLERNMQARCQTNLEKACEKRQWAFVLYCLIRNPKQNSVRLALKTAMKKKAWHVVIQLARLMTDTTKRDSLFSRMMKRRQWDVCRALLEQRLSIQVCLGALPQLMEMNQWTLVARVMEHEVPDDVRQEVMDRAWEMREGSVVWLCIKSLQTPLTVVQREALFQRAFSCQLWQVVKPLVEEKDETGIRHRDTALLEAIEQHQWDLVDHCQLHHADINMKDDDGHTPLQRAAMKKDWEAVEELVVRDGDPDLLDRHGYSVLHRAIESEQWDTVKLLIEYQADIHQRKSPKENRWNCFTPLSMLIDARQGQLIEHTLMWCPDQRKGINDRGETTLHAACLSGCWSSMYYLVARGVNPLAVTYHGNSVLVYALLNKDYPQRMLAECIRLGLSTHQPSLTDLEEDKVWFLPDHASSRWNWHVGQKITSPFMCAALHDLPVVMKMLYESGACSNRELFLLYKDLSDVLEPGTEEQEQMQHQLGHDSLLYSSFTHSVEDMALPYLDEVATTPRRLESACRLVISHCLTLRKTRHSDADQLPLTEKMKNFILFSDLTAPDYGKDTRWCPLTSAT